MHMQVPFIEDDSEPDRWVESKIELVAIKILAIILIVLNCSTLAGTSVQAHRRRHTIGMARGTQLR